jgi:uncharacterized protein YdhG (YjbR/CyaY superfamily)
MNKKGVTRVGPKESPATIDDYLSAVPHDQRVALERLRKSIQAAAPRAEECISYQMPAFRLDGKILVWFNAAKKHCSFFPGAIVQDYKKELKEFEISKGTIRFQPDHPIPAVLIRKLVKARAARIARA